MDTRSGNKKHNDWKTVSLFLAGLAAIVGMVAMISYSTGNGIFAANKDRIQQICARVGASSQACQKLMNRGGMPEVQAWCSEKCAQYKDAKYNKACKSVCAAVNTKNDKTGRMRSCESVCDNFGKDNFKQQCLSVCPSLINPAFVSPSATPSPKS